MRANLTLNATSLHIREVYPSLNEPDASVFVLCAAFLFLFVAGICGNTSTLTLIYGSGGLSAIRATLIGLRRNRGGIGKTDGSGSTTSSDADGGWTGSDGFGEGGGSAGFIDRRRTPHNEYLFLFLITLSLIDMIVLMGLPSAMIDSLIGFWIFGSALCKFHHFCNTVGRIASAFAITSMSAKHSLRAQTLLCGGNAATAVSDKEVAKSGGKTVSAVTSSEKTVRHVWPTGLAWRLLAVTLTAVALLFLLPILLYAQADNVLLFETVGRRDPSTVLHVRIFKCVDGMPTTALLWFTGSTFLVGYFLPFVGFVFVNGATLRRLRRCDLSQRSEPHYRSLRLMTAYIVMIGAAYFLSWAPYWTSVLYVGYVDLFESRVIQTLSNASAPTTVFFLYLTHVFCYVNAATAWMLYSRMVTHLGGGRAIRRIVAAGGGGPPSTTDVPVTTSWIDGGSVEQSLFYRNRLNGPRSSSALEYFHQNPQLLESIQECRRMSGDLRPNKYRNTNESPITGASLSSAGVQKSRSDILQLLQPNNF